MTESITWMTPLLPAMSVFTTVASSIFTPPSVVTVASAPLNGRDFASLDVCSHDLSKQLDITPKPSKD